MSRPQLSIRQALSAAAWDLAVQKAKSRWTFRDLAQAACVGYREAQVAVDNMRRAGQLKPVGREPSSAGGRPLTVYELATDSPQRCLDLSTAIRTWHHHR